MGKIVREKILVDLETELKKITTENSYRTEVKNVQRWRQSGNTLVDVPCLIISGGPGQWRYEEDPLVESRFSVLIDTWMRQDPDNTDPTEEALNDLLGDIFTCISVDVTRGGNAVDTQIVNVIPFETIEGEPFAGYQIELEVSYRFLRTNPETPA